MNESASKVQSVKKLKILQIVLYISYVVFMCLQALCIYGTGKAEKASNPKAQIYTREIAADALLKGLPLLAAAVAVTVIITAIERKTKNKSLNTVRKTIGNNQKIKIQNTEPKYTSVIRVVILILAVGLIALGIFNGSARAVLSKAITICSECIGLG